jgi:hypothetical protein
MSISTIPADTQDPLAAFHREADAPDNGHSPAPPPRATDPPRRESPAHRPSHPAGSRQRIDSLSPMEEAMLRDATSRRRNWLLFGFAALALVQLPFVVMWALQAPAPSATVGLVAAETVTPAAATAGTPSETKPVPSTIEIVTEPAQAAISVDGRSRGTSPVTVTDLTAGTHTVAARFAGGTVQRQIRVASGSTASLVITMPRAAGTTSGWLTAEVPASFQILENGRLIGTTDVDRLMLPVGQHSLEFVSEQLGFRTEQTVTVKQGATSSVRFELPQAPLSINAQPWAEVWIDGERIGETPLGNVSRPIGRHEVVFRHPSLGERRASVLVTLKEPARIAVDLRAGN